MHGRKSIDGVRLVVELSKAKITEGTSYYFAEQLLIMYFVLYFEGERFIITAVCK